MLAAFSIFRFESGSSYGGTNVKVLGDGFIPEETLLLIQGTNYTHIGATSYSEINFRTSEQLTINNFNLDIGVYVRVTQAVCLIPSCHFSWDTTITPMFYTISPSTIRGSTNLTITGQNFLATGSVNTNVSVTINNNNCVVNHVTNTSIRCTIAGVEAGQYDVVGYVEGELFSKKIRFELI